jgi:hypothetical protein
MWEMNYIIYEVFFQDMVYMEVEEGEGKGETFS